ncbi:MAG: hypothetical protein COA77_02535 [Thaumarchaeota archaeon]|nr:MAG: hypothetical protein COA77_02535 [Nitrososphaerota archaeon]
MQKELDEILKSITGKSLNSSSANLSKPKQFAIKLIDAFDSMASANAKTNFTQSVWKSIKWYMKNKIIPQKSDKETIADLRKMKETIDPLFRTLDKAEDALDDRKLNSTNGIKSKAQVFVESIPDVKAALEVLDEI